MQSPPRAGSHRRPIMLHLSWHLPMPPWQRADFVALYAAARTWWGQLPSDRRLLIRRAAAALVTFLALLVSFQQVVSGVVEQAALQRQRAFVYVDDNLRCQALLGEEARVQCRTQVRAQAKALAARDATRFAVQ